MCSGRLDLGQVQADEIAQGGRLWMTTAMSVFARLFVWGAVAVQRDERLIARVIGMVRRAARPGQAILFAVDGFKSYVRIILRTFRHPVYTGKRGRPRLVVDCTSSRSLSGKWQAAHESLSQLSAAWCMGACRWLNRSCWQRRHNSV